MAHRKGRSALTALGIVLGVGIFFGVLVSNASTSDGIDAFIETFTGRADVAVNPVGGFDSALPSETVPLVRSLPGVEAVAAGYGLSVTLTNAGRVERNVTMPGGSLDEASKINDYKLLSGRRFSEGADEVLIPAKLAGRLGARVGARLGVTGPTGPGTLTVAGILRDEGAGRANQGKVAYTSISTSRRLGGVGEVFDYADVVLRKGVDTGRWIRDNQSAVGPRARLRNTEELAQGFTDFVRILGSFFAFFAVITLFVGSFLIYLTLSMAVVERTRIYGTMRALGATRPQIARVVMAEAAVLGAVSTAAGMVFGLLVARGLLVLVSKLFEIELTSLAVRPGAAVAAVVVGMGTTLGASILPALRAGRLAPVIAMKGDYAAETRLGRGWIAGVAILIAGLAVRIGSGGRGPAALGTLLILLGAVLTTPLVLRPLASVLGRLTNRISPGVGDIAVLHLVKERSRSAYTLALIMVVMAMLFAIGGLAVSASSAIDDTLDRQFGADLVMFARGPVDPKAEDEIRSVRGVGRVTATRLASTRIADGDEVFVRVIDPATFFDVTSFRWIEGGDASARKGLEQGGILATAASKRHRGDRLRLDTVAGPREFPVVGVFSEFGGGPSQIVMGLPTAREHLEAGRPRSFLVDLEDGARLETVRVALLRGAGARYGMEIETVAEIKEEAQTQLGRYFNIFYAILLVAVVVGLLSLANTLAVSVVRRYREIGILRAIGVTRAQTWRMVLVESATLGLAAFLLSLPLGWLLSVLAVRGTAQSFDLTLPYRFPAAWVPVVAAIGVALSVLAAIAPGRRAARLQVVGALQYE